MFDPVAGRLAGLIAPERVLPNAPLAPYTTFKIGGPADLFCEPASASELALAVTAARELGVPYFVLGLGANILIGDNYIDRSCCLRIKCYPPSSF